MKILVISLPDSQNRRAAVTDKLAAKQIPFEFLDAVNGKTDQHPYFKNYNENKFLINRRRKAALGELGCYVSHLLAWEKCLALNEAVVVLEDDFELTDNFLDGLAFTKQFLDKVAFIRLEPMESRLCN
jgi:glycosyl transferase family 25